MFRKIALLLSLSLLFGFSASAQDTPRADVFVGYQYTRQMYTPGTSFNMNGGVGQIVFYPTSWLGVVGEVSGNAVGNIHAPFNGSGGTLYSYMGGARIAFRHGPLQPYVQVLFGAGQLDSTLQARLGSPSSTAFATAFGGGLDLRVAHHFAIRLVQGDYFLTRFTNPVNIAFTQNNFRLSTGVVFRF
jgi:Outer membrane protein beta-barrel domain